VTEIDPCFCWEHCDQEKIRNEEVSAMRLQNLEEEWAPIGAFLSNRTIQKTDFRLRDLANDDQNLHTSEGQLKVNDSIKILRKWADENNVKLQRDLVMHIKSTKHDHRFCENEALEHLAHCYLWNDDTKMFGVTYPQLASWVWARVSRDHENRDLLMDRFFEEVTESSGQCLNGNMARLINVFSAIDLEICPEVDLKITKEDLQTFISKSLKLPKEKALLEIKEFLEKTDFSIEEKNEWYENVEDYYLP
jgi:hypothetical protein